VENIIDKRHQGKGQQYLVRWQGEGLDGDIWLAASELNKCKALNTWIRRKAENTTCLENERPCPMITIPPLR
jgi:hypothetical protein